MPRNKNKTQNASFEGRNQNGSLSKSTKSPWDRIAELSEPSISFSSKNSAKLGETNKKSSHSINKPSNKNEASLSMNRIRDEAMML